MAVEQRSKSNTHQIEELKTHLAETDKIVDSVSVLANEMKHVTNDLSEVKADVKAIREKPAKSWDKLLELLIAAVVGAFCAWMTRA